MSRDPHDELSARLFSALRGERPPTGAESRALDAARRAVAGKRSSDASARLLLWAAALCGVLLALVAISRRERPEISIAAEKVSAPSAANRAPLPSPEPALPAPSAPEAAAPAPLKTAPRVDSSARTLPITLADELDALKVAQQALSASDPQAALKALDRYERVLKGQKLRAEATLLRIEALSRAGRREAAAALAEQFVKQDPTSPLADRARSFVEPTLGGSEHE